MSKTATSSAFRVKNGKNGGRKGSMNQTGGFKVELNRGGTASGADSVDREGETETLKTKAARALSLANAIGHTNSFVNTLRSKVDQKSVEGADSVRENITQMQSRDSKVPIDKKGSREASRERSVRNKKKLRRVIKYDQANESDDSTEMEKKYMTERLLLGMQVKQNKFTLLMSGANGDEGSDKRSSMIGKYHEAAVKSAGADIKLFHKKPAECIEEVEYYRKQQFEKTCNIREENCKEIVGKIRQQKLDQATLAGSRFLAYGRKMNRKTTLNIGTANMVSFETGEKKEAGQDEFQIAMRIYKRFKEEKAFLSEAGNSDGAAKITCTQLYNYALPHIPYNHASTYKLLPSEEDYLQFDRVYFVKDIFELCTKIEVPKPTIPPNLLDSHDFICKIFIYNDKVAIPYIILNSALDEDTTKYENIIVFHDIFDNMFQSLERYHKLLSDKRNKRVIMFHYPGQAYTLFDSRVEVTNEYLSSLVDGFFYHLENKGITDFKKQKFKFIGVGFGGNVLLSYLSSLSETYASMRHVMLVNSYSSVDDSLRDFMNEYLHELKKPKIEDAEFPFYFYSYISRKTKDDKDKALEAKSRVNTQGNVEELNQAAIQTNTEIQKTNEVEKSKRRLNTQGETVHEPESQMFYEFNPISVAGRRCLIEGVLKSVSVEKRIARIYLPMYIIHSLTNCLIDISHADKIEKVEVGGAKGIALPESSLKRKIIYVEGGHNIFDDNLDRMQDLLNKFALKR